MICILNLYKVFKFNMENNQTLNYQYNDMNNIESMMKLMQTNPIINTNEEIKDQKKMLETFILFQKFMNMNQMLDKQKELLKNEINKNENQTSQIINNLNNKIIINNDNNIKEIKKEEKIENKNIKEEINKENNQNLKLERKEAKPRIRRGENKSLDFEKNIPKIIKDIIEDMKIIIQAIVQSTI